MKILTVLGTRPEIIRLASVIKELDKHCNHILVHTGQNYDPELNQYFFDDLDLRPPDYILNSKSDTIHGQLSAIISQTGDVFDKEMPDGILVLGDTNSGLSVISAKRKKIPIFHLEAGDRSFDNDVPEELNRRIIDHTSDVNLCYTEHSRRNLLREGLHPRHIYVVGSPVAEVYKSIEHKLSKSSILDKLSLTKNNFFAASIHREENVDKDASIRELVNTFNSIAEVYSLPIVVSTHPRTKKRLEKLDLLDICNPLINWHPPLGLIDYLSLQINSLCVISDSGTIHEDSSILGFPALAIRNSSEKQESLESGFCPFTGLRSDDVLLTLSAVLKSPLDESLSTPPDHYTQFEVSKKVSRIIIGLTHIVDDLVWNKSR